ncbi:MAG: hypothetical protein HY426_04845 [Candidatus Levybacteria bacterium]|nr:hypothetical protein [Candidatus Levybacteria bacterium]
MSNLLVEAHRRQNPDWSRDAAKGYLETNAHQRRMRRISERLERREASRQRRVLARPEADQPLQDLKDELLARINSAFNGDGATYLNRAFIAEHVRKFERPIDGSGQITIVEL